MTQFIKVTRFEGGHTFVSVDSIHEIRPKTYGTGGDRRSILLPTPSDLPSIEVKETPEEILDLINNPQEPKKTEEKEPTPKEKQYPDGWYKVCWKGNKVVRYFMDETSYYQKPTTFAPAPRIAFQSVFTYGDTIEPILLDKDC